MGGTLGTVGNCTIACTAIVTSTAKGNGGAVYAANALSGVCNFSYVSFQATTATLGGGAIYA